MPLYSNNSGRMIVLNGRERGGGVGGGGGKGTGKVLKKKKKKNHEGAAFRKNYKDGSIILLADEE